MDINFNPAFGDIDVGITLLNNEKQMVQRAIIALKTNYMDTLLDPTYGADLDRFLGEGITDILAQDIRTSLLSALKGEGFEGVDIPYLIRGNTIHYRIITPLANTIPLDFIQHKGFKL